MGLISYTNYDLAEFTESISLKVQRNFVAEILKYIEIEYVNISEFLRNIEDRDCIESYKEAGRISARAERKSGRLSKIYESIGYESNGYGSESNHTHEF